MSTNEPMKDEPMNNGRLWYLALIVIFATTGCTNTTDKTFTKYQCVKSETKSGYRYGFYLGKYRYHYSTWSECKQWKTWTVPNPNYKP